MTMTASEAQAALPDLLSRVESGEKVTITRHGRPVAVLIGANVLHGCRSHAALDRAEDIQLLSEAASEEPPGYAGLTPARAEELIAEIRAGREA